MGTASASISLDISNFLGPADQAKAAMDELGSYEGRGGTSFFDRMSKGALALGTALIVPMGLGLNAAIDLEQSIANLNASLGGVDASTLNMLAGAIQDIGSASKFSATEVAIVADELAKAGISADNLISVTESVVNLSQATGEGLPTATAGIVQAMAVWQEATVGVELAMTDASRAADILTVAANQSTAGVSDVVAGLRPLGPVAASMGIGFDEAAAAIALFTQYGLSGAEAGTSLTRGLVNLADPTSEASALLTQLGISAFDSSGAFVGFPSLFEQLNTSMAGMSDQAQLMALSTIFGSEAMDVMGLAILSGSGPLEAMIALMGESGTAAEQSALRMNTLGAQFDALKEGVTTSLGSLVQGLLPGLRLVVDFANTIVDALMRIPGPIKTVIGAVAGFLAGFAAITRAVQGFQALNMIMGNLSGNTRGAEKASRGLLGGMLRFVPVFGLLTAGWLAWESNLFGIQGSTRAFVRGFRNQMGLLADTDFGPFGKTLSAIGVGLEYVELHGGPLGPIAGKLGRAFRATARFTDAFGNALQDVWKNGVLTQGTIKGIPKPLQEATRAILWMADGAFDLIRAFDEGGLAGLWRALPQELTQISDGFQRLAGEMARGAMIAAGWVLDVGVPAVAGWIADHADDAWAAISSAAGWAWDGVVTISDWVIDVAVPGIAAFGWDIVSLVLPYVTGFVVSLTDWVAQLDGADVVNGTLDLAGEIGGWIRDNPIPIILIGAGALSLLFFGPVGAVALVTFGLGFMIARAMLGEIPDEVVVPAVDLAIAIAGFTVTVADFLGEVYLAIGLRLVKLRMDWDAFWSVFTLSDVVIKAPSVEIDWSSFLNLPVQMFGPGSPPDQLVQGITDGLAAMVGGMAEGFNNLFGPGSPVDNAINAAPGKLLELFQAAWEPFGDSLQATWEDITSIEIPVPEFKWPEMPDIGAVPLVADFIDLLGNIRTMFADLSWSFDISLPTINWPNVSDVLANLPQWLKDFGNMSVMDWVKKYAFGGGDEGGSESTAPPEMDWGKFGQGLTIVSGNAALVASWLAEAAAATAGFASQAAIAGVQSTAFASGLSGVKDQIASAFTGGLESAKASLVDLATTAQMQTIAMAMAGLEMGRAFVTGVQASISAGAGQVAGAITALMAPAQSSRAQMALYGINAGLGYGTGVAAGIRSQTGAVAGAAASYLAVVSGYRGAMMAAGIGIGAALGQGIAAGIRSQIGAVAAAAASMVTTAVAAARAAGGIQSPSTVMRDQVGLNLALGTAEGILAGLPAIYSAANRMVYIPDVPNRGYAGGGSHTVVNNRPLSVNVTVEGNVTTEENLIANAADRIATGIANEVYRTSVAAGVAP